MGGRARSVIENVLVDELYGELNGRHPVAPGVFLRVHGVDEESVYAAVEPGEGAGVMDFGELRDFYRDLLIEHGGGEREREDPAAEHQSWLSSPAAEAMREAEREHREQQA